MIQYALRCAEGHSFESWFQSAAAFDKLQGAGMVECAVCGGSDVEKSVMAPRLSKAAAPEAAPEPGPLSAPASPAEQALAEIRRRIEAEAEYVGRDFARKAREMHDGETPHQSIWGEARLDEAKSLIEDGVPVAPLPFRPRAKTN